MGIIITTTKQVDARTERFRQDMHTAIQDAMEVVVGRIDELLDRVNVLITPLGDANAALAATLTTERRLAKELHDDPQHAALLAAREATDAAMQIQAEVVEKIRDVKIKGE